MKKLVLVMLMFLVSCGVFTDSTYDCMSEVFEARLTEAALDSVIIADSLPDPSDWLYVPARDYETGADVSTRIYIREITSGYVIYRIQEDSLYNISKRLIENK